jgi:hypothetical protein
MSFLEVALVARISVLQELREGTFLTLPEPTNRATIENDATVHTAEFEERKKSAIGDGTPELRTPTSIAAGRNCVEATQLRRNSVVVHISIGGWRKVNVRVHRGSIIRSE